MIDLLKFIGLAVVAWLVVGVLIYLVNKKACLVQYSDYQPSYSLYGDCRIVWGGKLTPVDMVKNISLN